MKKSLSTLAAVLLIATAPAQAEDWTFSIEPYLLAANIEGDAGMGRVNGVPVDVPFSQILETLDIGAMIHFEAHSANGWGVILDYGFMDLSDDIFGERGGIVDARVRQGTLEALLVKQSRNPSSGLEYFAGFRWWDNKVSVAIDPALWPGDIVRKIDASWIDLVIGARWTRPLNDRWDLSIKGDVGGFGVEADFTSSLAIGAVYSFSDRYALDLQYKALWVDYEGGTTGQPGFFSYDTVTHGPIVGFQFNF
ncbi:MAG: hypothetical protein ACR2QS_06875 [Woeseiaceae bacterium]